MNSLLNMNNMIFKKILKILKIRIISIFFVSLLILKILLILKNNRSDIIENFYSIPLKMSHFFYGQDYKSKRNNQVNENIFLYIRHAKNLIDVEKLDEAEMELKKAIEFTHENNLQSIIKIYLSRLQFEKKSLDSSLETIASIKDKFWFNVAQEIVGDIQFYKKNYQSACVAYSKALEENIGYDFIQMKLNNITSVTGITCK